MRTQHIFFTKFKKDTDEIQWFPRPAGPQCCKNLPNVIAQRPCSGATLAALPTAWNAAPTAWLLTTVLLIIPLSCPLNFCQTALAHPSRLSMSENWLTLFLLNLRISEPLVANMLKTVRINFRTLSRICVKADPWAIPTCRVLQGMVSSNSITLVIFIHQGGSTGALGGTGVLGPS